MTFTLVDDSDLPVEKYHLYSNATMERLLESLENFLDQVGNEEFEVEYNVSQAYLVLIWL